MTIFCKPNPSNIRYFSHTCFKSVTFLQLNCTSKWLFSDFQGIIKSMVREHCNVKVDLAICFHCNSLIAICLGDSDPRRMSTSKRHFEKANPIRRPSCFIKHYRESPDSSGESRSFTRARF